MSTPAAPIITVLGHPAIDRLAAAGVLRAARAAAAGRDRCWDEAVEWAFTIMPDSPGARRLRIEQLLAGGHYEAANALVAVGLRQRPTDAGLTLLRARSLFEQGALEPAARELHLVLAQRPGHRRALVLAGRVAIQTGDPMKAVALLQRVRKPDGEILELSAQAWLKAGRPGHARAAVERMAAPPTVLRCRVLAAEGRLLEACDILEHARPRAAGAEQDAITGLLIDLLEETADLGRLRRLLAPLGPRRPAILARAGAAWLAMGAFHAAAVRMAGLRKVPGHRAAALTVLMVAAAMMNRMSLARRAIERLRRLDEPVDRRLAADAWARGLLGRLLLDQCSARRAGADPHTGRLQILLGEAAGVFQEELGGGRATLRPSDRRELQRHLSVCEQVAALSGPDGDAAAVPLADVLTRTVPAGLAA